MLTSVISQDGAEDDRQPVPSSFGSAGNLLDGRYRLDELIGRGGTAEVYRATDELLGRAVAVKVFDLRLTDLNTIARQRSEMRLLAALDDPHLVAVYDARMIEAPGAPAGAEDHSYLVMELMPGGTLADRLRVGPLSPADAAPVGIAIAAGLAAAHARGLVHRDVKPANVLIARSGSVKLGDFGLARMVAAETRFTSGSALIGTAAYFSPEQARSEHVGAAADVYSLGLVLLEALSGRREFPGAAVPSAMARLLRDPQIPDGLPAPWPVLLLRMTDRDPEARPTAADVVRTLSGGATIADIVGAEHALPEPVLILESVSRSDAREESSTTVSSSILSAFLRPDLAGGSGVRRRNGLLVGAAALIAAVALTVGISMSGGPPSDAGTTPSAVQSSDPRQATMSPLAPPSVKSETAASETVTTPATRSAAATSSPRPPTSAVIRTTAPTSIASTRSRSTSTAQRATSTAVTESTLSAAPAVSRTSSAQPPPPRPASSTSATRPAATPAAAPAATPAAGSAAAPPRAPADKAAQQAADAERKAAEKAAHVASKAAEKEQKAARKDSSNKAKGGGSTKPPKKP